MCFAFNLAQRHDLRAAAILNLLRTQQNGNAARQAGFPATVPRGPAPPPPRRTSSQRTSGPPPRESSRFSAIILPPVSSPRPRTHRLRHHWGNGHADDVFVSVLIAT